MLPPRTMLTVLLRRARTQRSGSMAVAENENAWQEAMSSTHDCLHAAYVAGLGNAVLMMLRPPCTIPCPRGMQYTFQFGWPPPQVVVVVDVVVEAVVVVAVVVVVVVVVLVVVLVVLGVVEVEVVVVVVMVAVVVVVMVVVDVVVLVLG